MLVRIESRDLSNSEIINMLKRIKEFMIVAPVKADKKHAKSLILDTDSDKAIEKGLQSKMVEEKNFEKEFKKHSAKWRKHYSE